VKVQTGNISKLIQFVGMTVSLAFYFAFSGQWSADTNISPSYVIIHRTRVRCRWFTKNVFSGIGEMIVVFPTAVKPDMNTK
jgi:hypothetical protein